jgi:hydrogenase maturation protease
MNHNLAGNVIVLGIGNPLMSDEGVGIAIIEWFSAHREKFPDVDFIDAGTGGMSILHLIEGRRKVIIVDCAFMGTEPGAIRKFVPDEVRSVKKLAHQSLHEADILKIIDLAGQLGTCPQEIVFYGIEPETIELNQQLSKTITANMDNYISTISEELTASL